MRLKTVRALVLVLLVGLGACWREKAISVTSPAVGAAKARDSRWVLTHPDLVGTVHVATGGDSIYALACGAQARLSRIDPRGTITWTRELGTCFAGLAEPIAAGADRVAVALTAEIQGAAGARVRTFAPDGKQLAEQVLTGELTDLVVAVSDARTALCFSARSAVALDGVALVPGYKGLVVTAFDRLGGNATTTTIDPLYDRQARCHFDEQGELWAVLRMEYPLQVDIGGIQRHLDRGGWVIRIGAAPKFLQLHREPQNRFIKPVTGGWAVSGYREEIAFFDRDGTRHWRIELPKRDCSLAPEVIAASRNRLLVEVGIFCEVRGASVTFADLVIRDRSKPGDELAQRTIVVDLDARATRSRLLFDTNEQSADLHVLDTTAGLVAYGHFSGALGLGTNVHSQPPHYQCLSTLPTDAVTWDSYESKTPSCKNGYYPSTSYPTWPFVALLPR